MAASERQQGLPRPRSSREQNALSLHALDCAGRWVVAHWCTIGVSVIVDGSLMHHHRCVGDLGWVADAPEVPSSHRPLSLDAWMSTLSYAGLGGSRGVLMVDRAERR